MKKMDYQISLIRMISLLMIICCHILQGLESKWAFWINVGVQIFFFISGFLYGKREIKDLKGYYLGRIKKILLPFIILLTIMIFLEFFLQHKNYSMVYLLGNYLGFGGFNGTIKTLTHTWFISYILFCYLLVPFLQKTFDEDKFSKNIKSLLMVVIFFFLLQFYSVVKFDTCWINNFIFGYFFSKCCNNKKECRKYICIMFAAFLLIIPFAIIYQENLTINLPAFLNGYKNYIVQYGHVFLATNLFLLIYLVAKKIKIKKNFLLDFSDKYSYYIYLVHQIFILNYFSLLFVTKSLFFNILIIIVASILSGIILKKIYDVIVKIAIIIKNKNKIIKK